MSLEPKKLQKIRTFSGDVSAVRGAAAVPVPEPEEPTTPAKPLVTFAPVLNERKTPIVVPPVVVKAPTPPVPTPIVTPAPSSLQADITATLGGSKKPMAPLIKSAPTSVSPSLTEAIEATATLPKERVEVMDRGGDDLGGTVITNQKQDRFRLLPSMWEAVKLWFQQTENALARRAEKKRKAIPTVRTFEDRKDLIKKAASVGAIAPKDDYAKLAQKLPPRSKEPMAPAKSTVIIAEKTAVPAPTWGHFEGPGAPVLTEVKEVTPTVTQVLPAIVVPPPVPEPQPIPPPIVEPVIVAPPPPLPPPPPVTKPIERPSVEPVIFEKSVKIEPPPAISETPVVKRAVTAQSSAPRAKKNFAWLFYVGVTATAIVAIVSGAGLVSWLIGDSGQTIVTVTNGPTNSLEPTPIREDSAVKAILPQTRADWYANVSASGRGGVLTVTPVVNIGGAEKTAVTAEVLSTLNWGMEPALIRSISDITFVMAEQKPVIILKVTTFDSAFGGLLLSEKELSGELFPLFGPVVTSTYKVGIGTVAPEFIDELASNHDVRVLKDEMENERLVYGFVDQNTIVITPDKETFSLISERLR